jgi:hypothetical protein
MAEAFSLCIARDKGENIQTLHGQTKDDIPENTAAVP